MAKCHGKKAGIKHSDHSKELKKIKTIKGQIVGIENMIESQRYCTDLITQVRAVRSSLLSVEASMLETHLNNCFTEALKSGKAPEIKKKIHEVVQLFRQSTSKGVRL